jgi:hypothetical protein
VYRRLGDTDGIASALWGLARLDLVEEKMEDATPRISESYDILCRLGRADGIAVVGMRYGQLLAATDTPNEAFAVLKRSVEIFRKLGREADAQKAEEVIARLEHNQSPRRRTIGALRSLVSLILNKGISMITGQVSPD